MILPGSSLKKSEFQKEHILVDDMFIEMRGIYNNDWRMFTTMHGRPVIAISRITDNTLFNIIYIIRTK
jgi:hypothetical protein